MSSLNEIIGYKKQVEKLNSVCDFLKNTAKYVDFGISLPKGLLIYGGTGVGKTFMADALVDDSKRDIFFVIFDDLTVKGIKKIFKKASKTANAIVYIDDVDYLDKDDDKPVFIQLVKEMQSIKNGEIFVVMTADDKEDIPDFLLNLLGSEMVLELQPPKIEEACEIFKPIFDENKVEPNINIYDFCCFAQDWTYSEVKEAFNVAARLAVYEGVDKIAMHHLVKGCLLSKEYEPAENFDYATAYHEAGHAAVSLLLGGDAACIVLHGDGAGFFREKSSAVKTYKDMERRYMISVAGKACEEIFTGTSSIGSYSDLERVSDEIEADLRALASQGFEYFDSTELNSPAYNDALAKKVQLDIQKYYDRAKEIIVQNRPLIEAFVENLKDKFYLLHSEIYKIFNDYNKSKANG